MRSSCDPLGQVTHQSIGGSQCACRRATNRGFLALAVSTSRRGWCFREGHEKKGMKFGVLVNVELNIKNTMEMSSMILNESFVCAYIYIYVHYLSKYCA